MVEVYGLWPGVVAIAADADLYCVPCAVIRYGEQPIMAVVNGQEGYEQYTDHEQNPFTVVLSGSEDLHTAFCGRCLTRLCDDECECYTASR